MLVSVLNPRQAAETPSAVGSSTALLVEFALETLEDIERLLELRPCGRIGRENRTVTAAAEEQQHVVFADLPLEIA